MKCIKVSAVNELKCISINGSTRCITIPEYTYVPLPAITFLDSGNGTDSYTTGGLFIAYEGLECKLQVTNHEEIVGNGLNWIYEVEGSTQTVDSDGTITWTEPVSGADSRTILFTVYDNYGAYKQRELVIKPKIGQIYYTNVDGYTGVINGLSNFRYTFNGNTDVEKITIMNADGIEDWRSFCENCTNLKTFDIQCDTSSATSLRQAWHGCLKLQSFSYMNTSNVTNMQDTWASCVALTSFPSLDTGSVTNMYDTWYGCSGLTSFPYINTSNVVNMTATWAYCYGLTSFPSLDTSNVTTLALAWGSCYNLTSFPYINTSKVTNLNVAWSDCYGLTSFPNIDTSSVTNFEKAWYQCYLMTSFPHIDTSSATNLTDTWHNCNSLPVEDCDGNTGTSVFRRYTYSDGVPVASGEGKNVDCSGE